MLAAVKENCAKWVLLILMLNFDGLSHLLRQKICSRIEMMPQLVHECFGYQEGYMASETSCCSNPFPGSLVGKPQPAGHMWQPTNVLARCHQFAWFLAFSDKDYSLINV